MKSKFFAYLVLFFLLHQSLHSQVIPVDTLPVKDELSALRNDSLISELRQMLDSLRSPKSFFSVTASLSNRLFSTNNNAFNSQQSSTGVTAFIPTIAYVHKTGLGLSTTGYVRTINNAVSWYQTALTPSFDKLTKSIMYGVSYSYYMKSNVNDTGKISPFNHDIYAYLQGRKTWLRPSLSLGYGDGKYTDSYVVPRRGPNGSSQYALDKYNIHIRDFSMSIGVSHSFSKASLITKNDMVTFIPQISLISGMQNYTTESTTTRQMFRNSMDDRDRIAQHYRITQNSGTGFGLRTAAVSANLSWFKNALSVSTGYFLGYYFKSTSISKFSNIFNITAGVTF